MLKKVLLKNGETMAYRSQGSGDKILVLVHGNMTSSQHFDLLMSRLPEDIKVYAVDMRGFGGSSYETPVNALKDFSEDIKMFLDHEKIDQCALLGWSTGGGVCMHLAADYPDLVSELILVESVGLSGYPMFKKDQQGQPIVGEFITTKAEIAADPVQVLPILKAYDQRDKATLKAIWNLLIYTDHQPDPNQYEIYLEDMLTQRNLVDVDYALVHFNISKEHNGVVAGSHDVDKIMAPTLVFQGRKDLVVPEYMGDQIASQIKNTTYIKHPGGHSPFIDDLDMVSREIIDFIR